MFGLVRANGTLSDMVNLTRAKDAVREGKRHMIRDSLI
jgi:hypothetical protein